MNSTEPSSSRVAFEQVLRQEREHLNWTGSGDEPEGVALALSGGGIRSASFALGVVQALVNRGVFKAFDYLSTVSGGGYLGTALTWLKHQYEDGFERQLGSGLKGDRTAELSATHATGAASGKTWLDYVRLHGNYLKPPSIGALSLVGVALRGLLFSLLVYGVAAIALLTVLSQWQVLPSWNELPGTEHPWYSVERWVTAFACLLGFQVLLYGLATWLTSVRSWVTTLGALALAVLLAIRVRQMWAVGSQEEGYWVSHWPYAVPLCVAFAMSAALLCVAVVMSLREWRPREAKGSWGLSWHYRMRTTLQQWLGGTLGALAGLLVLWSIPAVYGVLFRFGLTHESQAWLPSAVGALSTVLAGAASIGRVLSRRGAGGEAAPSSMLMTGLEILVSAAVIYGILILAFAVQAGAFWFSSAPLSMRAGLACAAGSLALGLLCNVNYVSLGRVYRDRLMEMFMPNKTAIQSTQWEKATEAESAKLADVVDVRPFHLVNCNVVMVDAKRDSFRGRGGDSFVLSPLYSGSSATGWVDSHFIGGRGLPLATAMATSGAAANPDAGVAGSGITRNRLVSFLMWFFNVRLGYWIRNPGASWMGRVVAFGPPNFWFPGLWQGLLGRRLQERAAFVELTDGGHFDNTALYELLRRRVKVIVLSEAGADPDYKMEDIANAIERSRVDFGIHIRFDVPGFEIGKIRPDEKSGFAERGFAIATIYYPALTATVDAGAPKAASQKKGYLLYLQATKIAAVAGRVDIDAYARSHLAFPNESTADQFFDEDQLEAYRELGMEVAEQAMDELKKAVAAKKVEEEQTRVVIEAEAKQMQVLEEAVSEVAKALGVVG